jgi:uncharacterized protein YbjT (DUF2867 family)
MSVAEVEGVPLVAPLTEVVAAAKGVPLVVLLPAAPVDDSVVDNAGAAAVAFVPLEPFGISVVFKPGAAPPFAASLVAAADEPVVSIVLPGVTALPCPPVGVPAETQDASSTLSTTKAVRACHEVIFFIFSLPFLLFIFLCISR